MEAPPPPPPPHGEQGRGSKSGGLPDGKYDIFVIPPSSAGSGFLYLPSLQTQRNSFLAGCACTAAAFFIYSVAVPVIKDWFLNTLSGGGSGVLMLVLGVGVVSWALGKTQGEGTATGTSTGNSSGGSSQGQSQSQSQSTPNQSENTYARPPPQPQSPPPPKSSWQRPQPSTDGKTAWEKAREETRKREEERKRAEELKKRREELEKERQRQREKERLEKLERELKEKTAQEAARRAKEEVERKARLEKERQEREKRASQSPPKRPPMPSARTERDDDAYSFRPYDRPKSGQKSSAGSVYSEESYAPSATTAKTTPPPSARGPYHTKDPDKIIIKGVYSFNNAFMRTPVSQLISGQGNVTDGLILRITTEGLFIDDDVRGVPQREWDIKAWTMKLAESCEVAGMHILRATIRDQEGKKYVFVLSQSEGWKVAVGLQRLRKGSQVRALGVAGLPTNEAKMLLENLGWC